MEIFHPIIVLVTKLILGLILTFSGAIKIVDLRGFFIIVVQYNLVKGKIAKAFAYSLPFIELILGALLLSGYYLFFSALFTFLVLLASTFAVVYALYSKNKMDNCGCYGTLIKIPINKTKLLENLILILFAVYLIISGYLL